MSRASPEQTRPKSGPKVHPYQVGLRSKNSTWESANGLGQKHQLAHQVFISWAMTPSNELKRDLTLRYTPTKLYRDRSRIAPGRALTGFCPLTDRRTIWFKHTPFQLGCARVQRLRSASLCSVVVRLPSFLYAKPSIPGGMKSIFTIVIHNWFAHARTIDEY